MKAELSLRAIFIGLVLSVVMGAANVYLGLKAGMTVSASIPAAVIAMVVLRGLFRNGTILESNQVQTAASAGESLAAGIIFTMPALILIGFWSEFDFVTTTLVAFTGGLLGILFMIPMRKVFVTGSSEELKYPEGVACAAVLKAGESGSDGGAGVRRIVQGALIGGLFKFFTSFIPVIKGALEAAGWAGNRVLFFGTDVSPALMAVGYIVGLNVASLVFIGGGLAWLLALPMLTGGADPSASALDTAWTVWSTQIRYIGVGAMVLGGVVSIFKVRGGLVAAVAQLTKREDKSRDQLSDNEKDLPGPVIVILGLLATFLVGVVYYSVTGNMGITILTTGVMVVMSFFFTAVASYIVGLVGNSNSPVSGMTITAVLFTGFMVILFGYTGMEGMVATLGVAAIVCCAACTSGDVCNDLKTGSLVGAAPYRQQIMQISGVLVASLIMAPTLQLLHDYTPGGIGGRELSAPQAALFANLAKGFFGEGTIPWDLVGVGVAIGLVFLVADELVLAKKKSSFRLHLMPIAVGMYLPFGLSVPIIIGGFLNWMITKGRSEKDVERVSRGGVLFSSGTIAGESLMGVGLALLASVGITRLDIGLPNMIHEMLSVVAFVGLVWVFFWVSKTEKQKVDGKIAR